MSLKTYDERARVDWTVRVVESLRARGYFYDRDFCSNVDDVDALVRAARSLAACRTNTESKT